MRDEVRGGENDKCTLYLKSSEKVRDHVSRNYENETLDWLTATRRARTHAHIQRILPSRVPSRYSTSPPFWLMHVPCPSSYERFMLRRERHIQPDNLYSQLAAQLSRTLNSQLTPLAALRPIFILSPSSRLPTPQGMLLAHLLLWFCRPCLVRGGKRPTLGR